MADSKETLLKFFSSWMVSKTPNSKGEFRMFCPIHERPGQSKTPSATINFDKGLFHCNAASCVRGMTVAKLKSAVRSREGDVEKASYNPFAVAGSKNVVPIAARRSGRRAPDKPQTPAETPTIGADTLTEAKVLAWHRALLSDDHTEARKAFMSKRGLTLDTIKKFQIGLELRYNRYTIPIRDVDGNLVNVRKYKPDADPSMKLTNHTGYGSPPRLFPAAELGADKVLVVEGELDALIAVQNGFAAVSGTGGAGRWSPEWSHSFEGKIVYVSYDNDREGRIGAKKVAKSIAKHASRVFIVPALMEENKSDITDFFQAGHTALDLMAIMDSSPEYSIEGRSVGQDNPTEATEIRVIGSMDSSTNGIPLAMNVTVTGRKHPTYSVPKHVALSCTMDSGPKCQFCPMQTDYEGDHEMVVDGRDVETIARFIDIPEDKRVEVMRKAVGAQKCTRLSMEVVSAHTVEELYVTSSVDARGEGDNDYTQRRLYNVGNNETGSNTVANVVGTTHPNPKDGRNEFYSWEMEEARTSLDSFVVTPEILEQLQIFKVDHKQSPLSKAREVAEELSSSVTGIYGRERLHMAIDLTYHSVLNFRLGMKLLKRGWLEFIVVGDTRTGKSETALRLSEHYGLGHVIGCEGATFAGLVGGVKQVGNDWTVQWGELTINDRRLCTLDEASGLSHEVISKMSDVRSRGWAQITKIEQHQTNARVRLVWISNARDSKYRSDKKIHGADIVRDVIGNDEDIARFDLAMSVSTSDVPSSKINVIQTEMPDIKYTSEACRNLILWAWSRTADDVVWSEQSNSKLIQMAEWMGNKYTDDPPLIQIQSVKEKIARVAVALAARVFSTDDETHTKVIVRPEHVSDAAKFMHELYSYENFGYYQRSERRHHNDRIARAALPVLRQWLTENPRILQFFIDRQGGSFRSQDMEEMAFMDRSEVYMALGRLNDAKMISKDKSQIVMEPMLQRLVRDIEKEMKGKKK